MQVESVWQILPDEKVCPCASDPFWLVYRLVIALAAWFHSLPSEFVHQDDRQFLQLFHMLRWWCPKCTNPFFFFKLGDVPSAITISFGSCWKKRRSASELLDICSATRHQQPQKEENPRLLGSWRKCKCIQEKRILSHRKLPTTFFITDNKASDFFLNFPAWIYVQLHSPNLRVRLHVHYRP